MRGDITLPKNVAQNLAFIEAFRRQTQAGLSSDLAAAGANYVSNNISDAKLPLDTKVQVLGRDTVYGTLELKYPLYTGGKISSLIEQAKLNKQIKNQDLKIQDNQLIYNVKKIYYSYILALKIYSTMKDSYDRMNIINDLIKDLYEGQSLSVKKTDFLKTNVTVSLMKAKLESFKSNMIITKNALKNLLAINQNQQINIIDKDFPNNYNSNKLDSKHKLQGEVLANNLELKKIALATKISDEKLNEINSSYKPTVVVFANTSRFYNSLDSGLNTDENRNAWNLGVNLSFNLFNGFKNENEKLERLSQKKRLVELNNLLSDALKLQIKNELIKNEEVFKSIKDYEKANLDAIEHRNMNVKAYEIGMVETKDVIEAQIIQTRSEVLYNKAKYEYFLSLANIDKLLTTPYN